MPRATVPSPRPPSPLARRTAWLLASLTLFGSATAARAAGGPRDIGGTRGGLLVQVGCGDLSLPIEAARSGRFLVQLLDGRADAIARTRRAIGAQGLYGLLSADRLEAPGRLPYTENLVNLLVLEGGPAQAVPLAEAMRVLCPGSALLAPARAGLEAALEAAGFDRMEEIPTRKGWIIARKPRPPEIDAWTHPRHGADGNAVSCDARVGPPARVRWIAGPAQEKSTMVSAAGRNFYGGVLARDAFNGLRLWERALHPSPSRGGFSFLAEPGSVTPVAAGERLLVVTDGVLLALDGASGRPVRRYPAAGTPAEILCERGTVIAVDRASIRGLDLETARLLWRIDAAQPRYVVAGDGALFFIEGRPGRGEGCAIARLDLATGLARWRRSDFAWASKVRRCVYQEGFLACEISTLSDDGPGNEIRVLSAAEGAPLWSRRFVPGMTHHKQARALFAGESLWVLEEGKSTALDPRTGAVEKTYRAGSGHCYPPVATARWLFAGELEATDLATGRFGAYRITKGACGRDAGLVPANGLLYTFPKHCVCWPMLRGYAALAPAAGDAADDAVAPSAPAPERRGDPPDDAPRESARASWPLYRHDAWRSGSTPASIPRDLRTIWSVEPQGRSAELGGRPAGPIAADWRDDPFVHGVLTAPVVAGGLVCVACPDAHEVVALDARTGGVRWRFTANGRIDTAPTIHRGLCLFGTRTGWVYSLRAADGGLVWRLRAAPIEARIVAYGQIESPWPVPGSVLVVDGVAFFAAGRQPLADGGIRVFAVDPATGAARWVRRIHTLPEMNYYSGSGLEWEPFDLLHREGGAVTLSRWLFDRRTGRMTLRAKSGFARLVTGGSGVMVPRGFWSYGPRYEEELVKERPFRRPLVVFRNESLYGSSQDRRRIYRRDFRLGRGETFDAVWFNKWSVRKAAREGGPMWRSERLARGATWSVAVYGDGDPDQKIDAMVLVRDALLVAGSRGGLRRLALEDGRTVARYDLPAPIWDAMAAVEGRVFVSCRDGRVICLGE